jgi:cellulose synthase/poly-beta-1,6-N-acetylglucosamine synthase-like glycosyltransferase
LFRFYRYLWYLIRIAASLAYRPVPLPENPTYVAEEDVTIIVPTIDAGEEFKEAARSWLAGRPKEIIIVTEEKMVDPLQDLANSVDPQRIRVITVPYANKRLQMVRGIKEVTTDIIVFADDDAIWPPTLLPYVLACFEDQKVGGVGTSQRVKPVGEKFTVWEVLAAFRLTIRNIEISASTHIDGGVCCLSGRTAAYRTVILKDPEFIHGFTHDYWLGKYHLNSGDDKFLTRWMVSHGWSTYIQCCKEAELLSTMKPNWRFLKQVLRWTRNTWRSDMRSLFMERHIWTTHPYVAFTMVGQPAMGMFWVSVTLVRSTSCSTPSLSLLALVSSSPLWERARSLSIRVAIIYRGGAYQVRRIRQPAIALTRRFAGTSFSAILSGLRPHVLLSCSLTCGLGHKISSTSLHSSCLATTSPS